MDCLVTIRPMAERKNADETSPARNTTSISLSPETNQQVNRWLDRNKGWGKAAFMTMLIKWFVNSPESMQHIVAATVPADMREEFRNRAHQYLDEMIERASAGPDPKEIRNLNSRHADAVAEALEKKKKDKKAS